MRIKGCQIIYHEHGTAWSNPQKNKDRYKKRITKYKKIIVNSDATKYLLKHFYKVDNYLKVLRSPVFIYEDLIYDKVIFKLKIKKNRNDKIIIGYIGRLDSHKNPNFLIELTYHLKEKYHKSIELHFVGSGPEKENLQKICKEKKLILFFGEELKTEEGSYLNGIFCIVPSIREPLGLIPGEMALQNILTLSSKVDGLQELYPKECNYLLIDMKKNKKSNNSNIQFLPKHNEFGKNFFPDVDQCAAKIINLNKDIFQYSDLIKKHKIFIKKNFDILKHSEKLKDLLLSKSKLTLNK